MAPAADYAGQNTCLGCHEDKSAVAKSGAHARAFNPKTPNATQGCESCHGPGKAHAEAGGDKTQIAQISKLSAQEASERCTACHDRKTHALWAGSQHDNRNVGCTSCHSVHAPKSEAGQLTAKSESELCATCHDPHGSNNDRMLVAKQPYLCQRCHVTSRHPPTIYDSYLLKNSQNANKIYGRSCVACHQMVHGSDSPNGKALLR